MEELAWPEAKAWLDSGAIVVLPIGAIAKEHGPHLPLMTDWLLARELAGRVAAELPVLVAPVVGFGFYPAFTGYPGSQHLSAATFMALLKELLRKLIADGAQRVAVINTGVSTEGPVNAVVRELYHETGLSISVADIRRLGNRAGAGLEQKLGGHADEAETSMILAIAPERVRLDLARPDYGSALDHPETVFITPAIFRDDPSGGLDYSATGARGDPTLATAEKGEHLLAAMAAELVEGLRLLHPDAPQEPPQETGAHR
jgi:creatinine amidohydrolase